MLIQENKGNCYFWNPALFSPATWTAYRHRLLVCTLFMSHAVSACLPLRESTSPFSSKWEISWVFLVYLTFLTEIMSCQTCLKKRFANDLQTPKFLSVSVHLCSSRKQSIPQSGESHESSPYKALINRISKLTCRSVRECSSEWFHCKRKETSEHLFFSCVCGHIKHSASFFPRCITYFEIHMLCLFVCLSSLD